MQIVNVTSLRKNIYQLVEQTVKYNAIYNVTTKDGDAVLISKEEYDHLMEMMFFNDRPRLKKDVIEGLKTPSSDCLDESEVDWNV